MTKLPLNAPEMGVSQLLAVIEQLTAENAQLHAELEQFKRSSARTAAPFSKNQRKKNPKRPGRKADSGPFHYRAAPTEEQYTAPLAEMFVTETACPECSGELLDVGSRRSRSNYGQAMRRWILRQSEKTMKSTFALFIWVLGFALFANAQDMPKEAGKFRAPQLVELIKLDATIKLDIRYATANNFVGKPVYQEARAFLQRPAAEALVRAHQNLKRQGYGLLIFDGYRPWAITKLFWDITPPEKHNFVANPAKGSKHNRGCAVDLSLYDLRTGQEVQMPGAYDEMTERSYPTYKGGTAAQRAARDLLRRAMEAEGFRVNEYEWWHFDYRDWPKYPILNLSFAQLDAMAGRR